MKKRVFALAILVLGFFFLLHPQTSQAVSCKCTVASDAGTRTPGRFGCVNLDPGFIGQYLTSCDQFKAALTTPGDTTEEKNNHSLAVNAVLVGTSFNTADATGLNSGDVECATFSDDKCATPFTAPVTALDTLQADLSAKKPVLEINIPGVNFSDVASSTDDNGTYFYIAWIPELISGLYKFLLAIVSIVAVVVIIIQGLRVVASGGGEGKSEAYKKIFQCVVGLFIAWGSYAILYTINPALVQFNALKVKVVEGIGLDDESFADIPEDSADTTGGGGATIESLIGTFPSDFVPCSKQGAQYAAKKIQDAIVCVGPCHCAWTASRFLTYIGCTNPEDKNSIADQLASLLEKKGWTRKALPSGRDNRQDLPVGLLYMHGHVGVSLGDGLQFQSVGNSSKSGGPRPFDNMNTRGGGNCPSLTKNSTLSPGACDFCAKITGQAPPKGEDSAAKKAGANYVPHCTANQTWVMDKIWSGAWTEIIYPPS